MKHSIKRWDYGKVIHCLDLPDNHPQPARAVLEDGVKKCVGFAFADLSGENLTNTNLVGAYLVEVDLADANCTGADMTRANLSGAGLRGAIGLRRPGMPDPAELRQKVAEIIRADDGRWDQDNYSTGNPNACSIPCCVYGWACRLGGGTYGYIVATAATILLWQDGKPMPPDNPAASNKEILAALTA